MSVIVNTDYESVLFDNKPSLKMLRELEFLGLWLNDSVQNVMDYDDSYLEYIAHFTGRKPILVHNDKGAQNWWGALNNREEERYLNSKKTSFLISQTIGESVGQIIENGSDLLTLDSHNKVYLFKSFSGVSGKGHKFRDKVRESDLPLLAEEYHLRELDFSTYCFENGESIFYENFISPTFGYKGSFFDLKYCSSLWDLDFVNRRDDLPWEDYLEKVSKIIEFVRKVGERGFSIDSYIYGSHIRALCEINYRRTMGLSAFEIARAVSKKRFQLFLILKSPLNYLELRELSAKEGAILLSHDKNMFSYLLISADSKSELRDKLKNFESVLGTLAINIE